MMEQRGQSLLCHLVIQGESELPGEEAEGKGLSGGMIQRREQDTLKKYLNEKNR